MQTGNLLGAVNWMSLAVTIQKTTGSTSRFMPDRLQERYLNELKSSFEPEVFNAMWEASQRLTMDQAIAYGEEHLITDLHRSHL